MKAKELNIAMVVEGILDWEEVRRIVRRETSRCKKPLIILFNEIPVVGNNQLEEITKVQRLLINHESAYAFITTVSRAHYGSLIHPNCAPVDPYKKGTNDFPLTTDKKNQFRLCRDILDYPINKEIKNFFVAAYGLDLDNDDNNFNWEELNSDQRIFINDHYKNRVRICEGSSQLNLRLDTDWIEIEKLMPKKFGPLENNVSAEVAGKLGAVCGDKINVYVTGLDYKL